MIFLVIFFFLAGVLAILLEAFLPFGISAAVGVGLIILGGYLEIQRAGPVTGTLYCAAAFAAVLFLLPWSLRYGIRIMALKPAKPRGNAARRASKVEEETAPETGEIAQVIQPLRPTGTIEWRGRRLPARTLYPERPIAAGAKVLIRSRDSVFYLVEEANASELVESAPEISV